MGVAAARTLGTLLSPRGRRARFAVFTYHQVLEARDPLRPGEPDRSDFARDMEIVAGVFCVLPLEEAVRRLADGTLPARAACITFDDGYANNHELAAPILEAAGVPATFFVAGGAVDDGIMWNDLVIEAVARARSPAALEDMPGVHAETAASAARRAERVSAILDRLKYLPFEQRAVAADELYRVSADSDKPRLMMSRAMVADLARRGFDIGGHTLNHPILKELTDEQARFEIESCSAWIESVTGRKPKTFAYPNGRPGRDFLPVHAAMVAEAGFEAAVSTEWAVARPGTDLYAIPRIGPWWRQGRTLTQGFMRTYLRSYTA